MGAQIENNQIDLMIFAEKPDGAKPHEPDTKNIFRLCDMHNIPLATNLATAELLIKSLDRGDLEMAGDVQIMESTGKKYRRERNRRTPVQPPEKRT